MLLMEGVRGMFTGLVEEMGYVEKMIASGSGARMVIRANSLTEGLNIGDSVSVDGVCLTAVGTSNDKFEVDIMPETLRRSTLSELRKGCRVNLERALRFGDRLGGHLVSGHIDARGTILSRVKRGNSVLLNISAPKDYQPYIIDKGSIAVNGVSLTVVSRQETSFSVSIIPHTLADTTLGLKKNGDRVNLEFDMIAKYVDNILLRGRPVNSVFD